MMLLCFPTRSANNRILFRLIMMMATRTTTTEAFSFRNLFCRRNPYTSGICSTKGRSVVDDWTLRCKTTINDEINNDTAMVSNFENDNSTEFVYLLQNEVKAWHMGGSSNQKAERRDKDGRVIQKFKNHKAQWMTEMCCEWPSKCSIKDCSNVPIVGAHVVIEGKENVHLVPLCRRCNSDFSKNWVPDIKESGEIQSSNGFKLETGTPCLELNHISREESVASNDPFSWIEMYGSLVLHVKKYNTTSIVFKSDIQLERWVWYQRLRYKTRIITSNEINLLEGIGFSWDPDGDSWNKKFVLLKQYKHKNGNCNVPQQYAECGVNLGTWLKRQRQDKKKNRLDAEKEKQLEDLGVAWEPSIDKWKENCKLLQQYKYTNGNCNVPRQYEEHGINLGWWLHRQRQDKKKNRLDAEKEKQLEDLGVIWEPLNDQWEDNFNLLQQYKVKNGGCNVPQQYEENGVNLGIWLTRQRQDKRYNKLDDEKEKRLEDLGVIWEPQLNQWEKKYELLERFKNEKGHCDVSTIQTKDEKYRVLGMWLSNQRTYYRTGKLSKERRLKLVKLGVLWKHPRKVK